MQFDGSPRAQGAMGTIMPGTLPSAMGHLRLAALCGTEGHLQAYVRLQVRHQDIVLA